jgi:hypothetical protein
VRECAPAGRVRDHIMNGDTKWPEYFVSLLDELQLHGASVDDFLRVGDVMRDAVYKTVYVGTGVPTESAGEALALEAIAEGEANRDVARLIDAPHCEQRQRAAVRSLSWHETMIGHAKRVLQRNLGQQAAR